MNMNNLLALSSSPAEVVAKLLIDRGLASVPAYTGPQQYSGGDWPAFASNEPSTPDDCLTVFDTTPRNDARLMPTGETAQHYGITIKVRSVDHPTGQLKAGVLRVALDQRVYMESVTLGSNTFLVECFTGTQVLYLGKFTPNSKHSIFNINCMVVLSQTS